MNILKLSLSSLKFRGLNSFLNILVLALGIATIITLMNVSEQIEQRFTRDLQGIDLVVGAKGSPIQLILSSVFHLDIPNGNIPLTEANKLAAHPLIKRAIPVALGDNYQGFRIVGTDAHYPEHYQAELAEGTYWSKDMQAVLGSEVARISHLKLGQPFVGSHGLSAGGEEHSEFPYTVVGILKPTGTVIDRLVLTGVGSVWHIHEHHHDDDADEDHDHIGSGEREITSLLISYKSPMAAVVLPRLVNKNSSLQAASPAFEIARLMKILGVGSEIIQLFAGVLIFIATIGFFVTLFNIVNDRQYDIALMRSLGATRRKIFAFVIFEGLTLGGLGAVFGILLGRIFSYGVQLWIEQTRHMLLSPVGFRSYEVYIIVFALIISAITAIIPAMMAYQINVAKVLSKGP